MKSIFNSLQSTCNTFPSGVSILNKNKHLKKIESFNLDTVVYILYSYTGCIDNIELMSCMKNN